MEGRGRIYACLVMAKGTALTPVFPCVGLLGFSLGPKTRNTCWTTETRVLLSVIWGSLLQWSGGGSAGAMRGALAGRAAGGGAARGTRCTV